MYVLPGDTTAEEEGTLFAEVFGGITGATFAVVGLGGPTAGWRDGGGGGASGDTDFLLVDISVRFGAPVASVPSVGVVGASVTTGGVAFP